MSNAVIEFQIISQKPEDTATFYQQLFGWVVDSNNALGYRRIKTGSAEGIQGGIWPAPPQAPTFTQLFIAVSDVAGSVAEAEKLGAKVLIPPTTLPDGEVMAVIQDPQGMTFGLNERRVP
jgi:uncharacterized protein